MPAKFAVRRWIALPLVLVGMLLPAASAQAALDLANPVAEPTNLQAGAHSNFNLSFNINGTDDMENLVTELPPGLVGNPTVGGPNGYCVPAQLPNCPPASRVGQASSAVEAILLGLPQNLTASGSVYNMIPQGNDPATLAIVLNAQAPLPPPILTSDPVILIGHASARTTDFGLNTTILEIPRTARVSLLGLADQDLQIHIDSTSLTLFGNPPFMTNPTSCKPATTRITASSYEGDTQTITDTFTPTNCAGQKYNPDLGVTIDFSKGADYINNPELTTRVTQGPNEANSKRVEAILPTTIQANNSALNAQCPEPNFQASTCSPATQVGTAVAKTPLLSKALEGPVYLIQNPGVLPRIGLDLRGPLPAKLFGNVTPTQTFRLDNVFDGLPDVPLNDFKLTFRGGKEGLTVATKALCAGDPNKFDAIFDSHGGQHVAKTGSAKVIGCAFKKRLEKNRCNRKKLTDVGTKRRDTIRGTRKRDVINGLAGKDKIVGLKGNDLLCGGKGNDKISGGAGKDRMFGGRGKDLLIGGAGRDKLAGGPGKDRQRQ